MLPVASVILLHACGHCPGICRFQSASDPVAGYEAVGTRAAHTALEMLGMTASNVSPGRLIAMSNAGYVEINGQSVFAAQDGLARVTRARRGHNELLEVHSTFNAPLWFAVYDRKTGKCAYLEPAADIDPAAWSKRTAPDAHFFTVRAVETVSAEYLYQHAPAFDEKMKNKLFGGNAFRVIAMANAVDAGAPTRVVKTFEFHDHYCPGVSSGIMMADFIKQHLHLAPNGKYFIQSVQPWCKEDALIVMLNTTPGKGGYAVTYPTDADKARWTDAAKDAATIVYRKNPETGIWDGMVLGFTWPETGCPDFGKSVVGKLCGDLFFIKNLQSPEKFVKVIHRFTLDEGVGPKAYARPGVDPMILLGLANDGASKGKN